MKSLRLRQKVLDVGQCEVCVLAVRHTVRQAVRFRYEYAIVNLIRMEAS